MNVKSEYRNIDMLGLDTGLWLPWQTQKLGQCVMCRGDPSLLISSLLPRSQYCSTLLMLTPAPSIARLAFFFPLLSLLALSLSSSLPA